jgi:ATP-dependent protease ClpP protease subunit
MRLSNKGRGTFKAEANTIWLYDAIAGSAEEAAWFGGVVPQDFIAQLSAMSGDVTLRINSPGGSVFGAQAMVAAIRQHNGKVTAQVDSLAASAASVIAVNCADCVMVPGAMMMIHKAWGMTVGNEADMRQTADLLAKLDGTIADAYARRTGMTTAAALDLMAAETWFTAQEAVDAGLAGSVMETDTQAPQARWDLSAFARAPKIEAAATAYNDADVTFVNGMVILHGQAITAAKAVLVAGSDMAVAGMAGDVIGEATECITELTEWLGEKGISDAPAPMPEDRIDAGRAARMRMAEAALLSAPI